VSTPIILFVRMRPKPEHREAVLAAIRRGLDALAPEGRFVERNLVYVMGARSA